MQMSTPPHSPIFYCMIIAFVIFVITEHTTIRYSRGIAIQHILQIKRENVVCGAESPFREEGKCANAASAGCEVPLSWS